MVILTRLLLFALGVYLLWRLLFTPGRKKSARNGAFRGKRRNPEEMKQDPACGTWIPVSQAIKGERDGETLYFCSRECRDRFLSASGD